MNATHTMEGDAMKQVNRHKNKNQYIVTYHHRDTQETIYRVCNSMKTANDWAEWTKRQLWVEHGTVNITIQQGGMQL